jgi:uncharacterized membrane protein
VLVFSLILSCKHEILGVNNPGTGPVNPPTQASSCSADTAYFQQQVLPIFISNCAMSGCHDAATQQKGLNLTNYNGIRNEVRPGNLNNSKIWERINETDPSKRMPRPPRNPLTQDQKDIIRKWILQGAINNSCASASCDTLNVTYSTSIRNIISNKCQGCHSSSAPAGGFDYTTYAGVKARVNDGKLWGAVNHLPGYSPMPKNGAKLSTCELAQIKKWIDAGAPNN